jgi:exonuclease SbcC
VIRKIILENYMSHARTEIEPAAGLTVLVGPNNCGKSAVISALETLARNSTGDFMVRHGTKEARVTVETDDGHVLAWRRRTSAGPSYLIDGREVHRLNRNVPEDLHDYLKLPLVQLNEDEETIDVHFGQQKSPIFLLNDSPARAAMFFSASSDAGRLVEIQRKHREKVTEKKQEKRRLEIDIARFDEQLEQLKSVDDVQPLMEAAEKEDQTLIETLATMQALEQTIQKLESAALRVAMCGHRATAHQPLQSPPEQNDTQALAALMQSMTDQQHKLVKSREIGASLASLKNEPVQSEIAPLEQLARSIETAQLHAKQHHAVSSALEPLRDPPPQVDPAHLTQAISQLTVTTQHTQLRSLATDSLRALPEPPVQVDVAPLEAGLKELTDMGKRLAACNNTLTRAQRELKSVEFEFAEWVRQNPNCPICNSPISAQQLIESGGHDHG